MKVEELANKSVGNWKKFESFGWVYPADDADGWTVWYTHSRDSDSKTTRRGASVGRAMRPYCEGDNPDARLERHRHWAVGWVEGVAVRVFDKDGDVTPAFKRLAQFRSLFKEYEDAT